MFQSNLHATSVGTLQRGSRSFYPLHVRASVALLCTSPSAAIRFSRVSSFISGDGDWSPSLRINMRLLHCKLTHDYLYTAQQEITTAGFRPRLQKLPATFPLCHPRGRNLSGYRSCDIMQRVIIVNQSNHSDWFFWIVCRGGNWYICAEVNL